MNNHVTVVEFVLMGISIFFLGLSFHFGQYTWNGMTQEGIIISSRGIR